MYLEACLQKRRKYFPFAFCINWLLYVEAEANLKMIAIRLATKWQNPYLRTCGYVNSKIAINLVR